MAERGDRKSGQRSRRSTCLQVRFLTPLSHRHHPPLGSLQPVVVLLCRFCKQGSVSESPVMLCRSVFYLPKPRALNYLVSTMYGGPCLILQVSLPAAL